MPLYAAIDIGTTTLKAGLFDDSGQLRRERSVPHPPNAKYGWDGIDPCELFASIKSLIRDVAGDDGASIKALGISSFGETAFPSDSNGPLHFGIHWYENCTRPQFERAMRRTTRRRVREITKLDVSWVYSSCKIMKFKDDYPELYDRTLYFLDTSSCVAFMMTGEAFFDLSLASRTQLLDLSRAEWSEEMASLWEIDMEKLPPLLMPTKPRGTLKSSVAGELGLKPDTIVTVAGHDHISGALGSGVSGYGQGMISAGTSVAFFSPMPPEAFGTEEYLSLETMSGGYSACPGGMNALTGIDAGGFCVDWFVHKVLKADYGILREFENPIGPGFMRTNALFLPNMRGHVANLPPGGFTGVTDKDTDLSLLQAIMESIAFECKMTFRDIFNAKKMAGGMKEVVLTGGAARNRPFVHLLANALGSEITIHHLPHSAGLLGGAMAAAIASGRFANHEEAGAMLGKGNAFHPEDPALSSYLEEKYARHMAVFRNEARSSPECGQNARN
jgi:sugar (pentulose or hexulose) kinase